MVTLETLYKEMKQMRSELHFLRHLLEEEYELSDEAIRKLEHARKTPRSAYISHEDVKTMVL